MNNLGFLGFTSNGDVLAGGIGLWRKDAIIRVSLRGILQLVEHTQASLQLVGERREA